MRVAFSAFRDTPAAVPDAVTVSIVECAPAHGGIAETPTGNALATADFVCDSPIAAACFILARVLGLASPILTADPQLFDVIRAAVALAPGYAGILVEGEIGLRKEALIKLIHAASGDPASLVYAECAGLEAAAVAAEIAPLLASAPGPAHAGHLGRAESLADDPQRFASAAGRTIFLNHLGELSLAAQRNLLDLLRRPAHAAVRLLAVSVQPLAAMVARREFLADLHQRFAATLTITPLRDRPGDLPMLVRHGLRMLNPALTFDAAAIRTLARYRFPATCAN